MISWSQVHGYSGGFDSWRFNAVEAGYEVGGAKLYVGRGNLEGGVHVGKIHEAQNACYIPLFGKEHCLDNFEVLSVPPGVNVHWVQGSNGQVPPNAVEGGRNDDGSMTYIGRIQFNGTVTPGEIVPGEGVCYISFMGREEESEHYEVLVTETSIQRSHISNMISWNQVQGQGFQGAFDFRRFNAVEGGYETDGKKLYVGRGNLEGGVHVGKIHQDLNACFIPIFGKENRLDNFEVLSVPPGVNVVWMPGSNGQVPPNAVEGGRNDDGTTTYIGRMQFSGTVTPGEIVPKEGVCYISFMGKEEESRNYEVLCMGAGGQPMPFMAPHAQPMSHAQVGAPPPGGVPGGVPSIHWVNQNDSFNPGSVQAFEGGYDRLGAKLYVGRALLAQGCHVGKVRCDIGICYVPYESAENQFHQYQVLCTPYGVNVQWVAASNGNVPPNAVEGGYNDDRSKTYVGRAHHDGAYCPGEVVPKDGLLYIAHEGEEVEFEHYEVLVLGPPATAGYGNASAPPF